MTIFLFFLYHCRLEFLEVREGYSYIFHWLLLRLRNVKRETLKLQVGIVILTFVVKSNL